MTWDYGVRLVASPGTPTPCPSPCSSLARRGEFGAGISELGTRNSDLGAGITISELGIRILGLGLRISEVGLVGLVRLVGLVLEESECVREV